jgi:hypothetical protein
MTTFPLSGREGDIFLRALREYSDSCSAPALTPGCPFAVDIGPGQRGCGEECVDLLASYQAPMSIEEVQLGKGLAVRPRVPRSRRGPGIQAKPFDAAELLLADKVHPITSWRSSSLLRFVLDQLSEPPPSDPVERTRRRDGIEGILGELDSRGFDTHAIVSDPGAIIVMNGIALATIVPVVMASAGQDVLPTIIGFDTPTLPTMGEELAESWAASLWDDGLTRENRLTAARDNGPASVMASVTRAIAKMPALVQLLRSGPVSGVIDWDSPVATSDPELEGPDTVSHWVVDRFTKTYLEQWDEQSLLHEWEWLHGQRAAPCDPREMQGRSMDSLALNAEIASRRVLGKQPQKAPEPAAQQYVLPASEMLREGRRQAAAAIFEALTRVSPDDRVAHNNFGFCLIPDSPELALAELEIAADLGMRNDSMNTGNRMLALSKLGRVTTAIEIADRFYDAIESAVTQRNCFMWSFDENPELINVPYSHLYVAELAEDLARRAGDAQLAERWHDRADALRQDGQRG